METSCWHPTQYTSTSLIHFDVQLDNIDESQDMEIEQNKGGAEHKLNKECLVCKWTTLMKAHGNRTKYKEAAEQLHHQLVSTNLFLSFELFLSFLGIANSAVSFFSETFFCYL